MYFPLFVGVLCLSFLCYALLCVHFSFAIVLKRKRKLVALLCVHFSFAIVLKRKRKLVALLSLPYRCIVTLNVLWLFLMVPWVGKQFVIVVFPDHTHLLFAVFCSCRTTLLPTCHKLS